MRSRLIAGLAFGAVALTAAASHAQSYNGWYHPQPVYAQPGGDYNAYSYRGFGGYPEFRGVEQHIRSEIQQLVREQSIEPDDGRALFGQLRRVQDHERHEFRFHAWNLPEDDRASIRSELDQLDHQVDRLRDDG